MLRQEMNLAYFDLIHRPGEKLGVFDNGSDFECCAERTHCNCTHGGVLPKVVWNEQNRRYELDSTGMEEQLKVFGDIIAGRRHTILDGAEHNNVYFPGFYAYREHIPQALMQDIKGEYLELRSPDILDGKPIPMPAIDDPDLLELYAQQLAAQAQLMPGRHHVAAYVMGAEMLYPEYFGLGHGDYRPTSWKHFSAWCENQGIPVPNKEDTLLEGSDARKQWLRFREQAMADRAAYYYRAILQYDQTHLCFYPTHGSTLRGSARAQLGQQPDTLVSACDGIEMGHILIDDDAERRNVIMTGLNASYGTPVIIPRLGNKTPDLGMAGGGRSFTPITLRRLVYEAVGMGVSIIFPIHWRSHLHDGEWFIKNTPAEATCRAVFDELITAAPYMQAMGRLQPQVGILASDATWLQEWRMRWTALMQDMLAHQAHATLITDALIHAGLSKRMPLLLLVDDANVEERTMEHIRQYLDAGGKAIIWGQFATDAESTHREAILRHPNCLLSRAEEAHKERVIREMFLSGMQDGTTGERYCVRPIAFEALEAEIRCFAPEVILHPFKMEGAVGEVDLYPLTDRAALGCVCINHGGRAEQINIKPDERLLRDAVAVDMLTGERLTMPVMVEPHGTRLIFFASAPEDPEALIVPAEDAFETWRRLGAQVGALRQNYTNMRSGAWLEKRAALANALLHSLALRVTLYREEHGEVKLAIDAYGPDGQPLQDATITLRIVPGNGRIFDCHQEDGQYICRIAPADRPQVYDPRAIRYVPLTGCARVIIQAECGQLQGGCMCHIDF